MLNIFPKYFLFLLSSEDINSKAENFSKEDKFAHGVLDFSASMIAFSKIFLSAKNILATNLPLYLLVTSSKFFEV